MKNNGLLKWLMIPMVALLVFVGIQVFSARKPDRTASGEAATQLTPEEMKALGIDGDTPRDTVATLVAQVKQLRNELQTSLGDNKNQRAENERLRQREGAIDQRIQAALDSERSRLQQEREQTAGDKQQTQGMLQDLQHKLDQLGGKGIASDLPVGLGLEDGDGKGFGAQGGSGVRWIEPDDARPDTGKGSSSTTGTTDRFPMHFGSADGGTGADGGSSVSPPASPAAAEPRPARPVYTVPTNATLMGSVAMTALIGRVPIDGTVNDPYPFKVLIGPDNLTANGIDLPEVAGAVMSGTASGDWTLSCVRGQIRSVTFVFRDGTIRTLPEDKNQGGGASRASAGSGNAADGQGPILGGMGWISDPHGIPCVSGERRSNAQQYLGSHALITAAGAGAASLIKSDSGSVSVVSNGNGSLGTVGISGNEAMGRILAGGVQEMSQWVNKLYGQAFAAVYVPPGAQVAVHLEQPLQIDYDAQGRKVRHPIGGTHAIDLD
ncbi:TIGR03752 family integrating conjugative element protein [Xanthomonas euvesicatoria]|uniref:TIGR03752 family integrating conjugative element protein n=1 Tax=Xanthomonas citri TaxID=346 RepID=UPI000F80C23F|nr:TIGR03752 family integrating conjugative element protein [Xanthomonas axonopodis]MEE5091085.1 TIGR03752 family integrating conjugative element protein [Xanthomonas euvesicatoria]RTE56870.1 TIGR03752 family integrating conjugative element protein [Xanthomonas axonopodis pv. eucalyptorum]